MALKSEVLALEVGDGDGWEAVSGGVGECVVESRVGFEEAIARLGVDFCLHG